MCRYDTIVLGINVNSARYGKFTPFSRTLSSSYILLINKYIKQ